MEVKGVPLRNLKSHLPGRMRLHLFKRITGKEGVFPTKKQAIKFIEELSETQFTFAELFTYILTDGRYSIIDARNLVAPKSLEALLSSLERFPLSQPILYEIKNFKGVSIGAWVVCCKLENAPGHFYTIILLDEDPQKIIFYLEVRTCQALPEPAVLYFNEKGEVQTLSKNDLNVTGNWLIDFCLNLLNYISKKHVDSFLSIAKLPELEFEISEGGLKPPHDPKLDSLLKELVKKKVSCFLTEIEIGKIVPFSYDYCFKLPIHYIYQVERLLDDMNEHGVLVYEQGGDFILSDDYIAYLAFRKAGFNKVKAVVIGKRLPKNLPLIKKGSIELLPPLLHLKSTGYDQLEKELKDQILENYLSGLNAISSLNNLFEAKCIVLTEDQHTEMLEAVLVANDFFIDETEIYSYKNCTNLDALELTVRTYKSINPQMCVMIHRDRDYLTTKEIDKVRDKIIAAEGIPFITNGTAIESYFINAGHIHTLYPQISIERAKELIQQATELTKSEAINQIKKHEHGERYKNKDSYLDEYIEDIYFKDVMRYCHSKKTLGVLINLLQKDLKENPELVQPSPFLRDQQLIEISKRLW